MSKQQPHAKGPKLAPLPIPKFRGQLWEWDQFWGIFEATIHSRDISKIEKMHYLLEALEGPAKYARRHDNSEAVVAQLLQNLHDLQPRSSKIADQRQMLDKILPIISQLKQKGENTNTQRMRRTILAKFTDKVQRSMLKKKANIASDEWTTLRLLSDLQEFFDMEDHIQHLRTTAVESVKMDSPSKTPPGKRTKYVRSDDNKKPACFYCNKNDHTPRLCPEYTTYEQRIGLIRHSAICAGIVDQEITVSANAIVEHAGSAMREDIILHFAGNLPNQSLLRQS
ncbi:hypothetical protein ANCDUO_19305 [Ancylostoma duodenale]|uniref:CCHC-type domain-containing protein n=1 Tax=Ancylostoma duodenale TaxID=51022 RepID=A0A0C2C2S8_9BILA|nr:hypothetical protein ANCDUO_19305 [Ancylostoma duodenale]